MENGKKTSRSFDLEKGAKHSFDLEKKSTRRFDLLKEDGDEKKAKGGIGVPIVKSDSPVKQKVAAEPNVETKVPFQYQTEGPISNPANISQNANGRKKNWTPAVIAVIVLVLAIGSVFLFNQSKNEKAAVPQQVEQPIEQKVDETISETDKTEKTQELISQPISQPEEVANVKKSTKKEPESSSQTDAMPSSTSGSSQKLSQTKSIEKSTAVSQLAPTIKEQAKQVIRGDFGNGEERKRKLGAAYDEIQRMVNEMYCTENLQQ